jgi:putative oxidoreductase
MFKRSQDVALLILRVTFGFMMIYGHGWGKLMRFFGEDPIKFGDPIGIGMIPSLVLVVFAEFFCAAAVGVGLLTRLATIPLMIAMFVAAFVSHIDDPFSRMEKALMYLVVYLVIFLMGPGRYSLDSVFRKKA